MTPDDRLQQGLDLMKIELSENSKNSLLKFLEQLVLWNKSFNLTAVRDPDSMVVKHLLDSLSVYPHVDDASCLDLGTGAGLPGMVLAIVNPEQQWTLLDSNGKKTRFLTHARIALNLKNVEVVNARVEKWQNSQRYSCVISRAFTELPKYVALADPFCAADGRIWAMIGKKPTFEMGDVISECRLNSVTSLQVPFDDADRHLALLSPSPKSDP